MDTKGRKPELSVRSAPRIYCILCPSYHGATLLSLLLSNRDRVLALGDTLPARHYLSSGCGCGNHFTQCEFWKEVEDNLTFIGKTTLVPELPTRAIVKGSDGPVWLDEPSSPSTMRLALEQRLLGLLCLSAIKLGKRLPFNRFAQSYAEFLDTCSAHYDFEIFVDGYKSLVRYLSLKACGMPIAGVIHLARDPRAFVAASKRLDDSRNPAPFWTRQHRRIERYTHLCRENVLRVRYEDLCEDPDQVLTGIQTWMGLKPLPLRRRPSSALHWIGNGSLMSFDGTISRSDRWRQELSMSELKHVRRATGNLASEYGYDLA